MIPTPRALLLMVLLTLLLPNPAWCKKPKNPEPPTPESETPAIPDAALPIDLNTASLRISALDTLYQLDLSPDQLEDFAAAIPAPSNAARTPAKPNGQLTDLFTRMQSALLAGKDDPQISTLRNKIIDAVNSNAIELDDTVAPTPAAHAAAPALLNKLKASQLAAFLAMHADEVADPVELMMATASTLHDAKTNPDMVDDSLAPQTAARVGYLVAGSDESKAKALATQVADWLKTTAALSDADLANKHADLEAAAKKIVGPVSPIDVLQHYLQQQVAILLANPETNHALHLLLDARKSPTEKENP